jgi:hypothetical protein
VAQVTALSLDAKPGAEFKDFRRERKTIPAAGPTESLAAESCGLTSPT